MFSQEVMAPQVELSTGPKVPAKTGLLGHCGAVIDPATLGFVEHNGRWRILWATNHCRFAKLAYGDGCHSDRRGDGRDPRCDHSNAFRCAGGGARCLGLRFGALDEESESLNE